MIRKIVNFYLEAARKTAEHHLLIDFHGAYKPDGLGRTWPNALTREGVKGMENNKWSKDINPEHDVTIPFTRMVAGPMDYTPGAMVNMDNANFILNLLVLKARVQEFTRWHFMLFLRVLCRCFPIVLQII